MSSHRAADDHDRVTVGTDPDDVDPSNAPDTLDTADGSDDELPAAVAAYLEVIFELDEDDIESVQVRIAERLGVSRPAVSEMVRKLRARGMVDVDRGRVELTEVGREHAERRVRRHRIAERFLTDVLAMGWAEAHTEAEAWERVMNARTEAAMSRVLGAPTTCPHGNPIPGSGYTDPLARPLADLGPGDRFSVARITEQLEFIPGMLDALELAGLQPGVNGRLLSNSPDGSLAIELGDGAPPARTHLAVAGSTAERILVNVEGTP